MELDKKYLFFNDSNVLHENPIVIGCENDLTDYNKRFCDELETTLSAFAGNYPDKNSITSENIKFYLDNNGYTELILKVTDECNFRCKYCIYSDYYPYTEGYSNNKMCFSVAKKAVDYYLREVLKQNKFKKGKIPYIAFYGGEPLMNFDLIKQVILYIENTYSDLECMFTLTTNGLFLKNIEIASFLKKHNVIICLSLDGYKENHDRNRVTVGDKPSFDEIIFILNSYFKNYDNIYSLCCIDYKTNLMELYDFYKKNDRMEGGVVPHLLRVNFVNDLGTNYFEKFDEYDIQKYRSTYSFLLEKYIELAISDKTDWFLDIFIGQDLINFYDRARYVNKLGHYCKMGSCVPGDKIYVLPDGKYSICKKVCFDTLCIGDVDMGINYNKVEEIMKIFNEVLLKQCGDCDISSLCPVCYSHLISVKKLGIKEKDCTNRRKHFKNIVSIIEKIITKNPNFFEKRIIRICKENYKNKTNRVDYIINTMLR